MTGSRTPLIQTTTDIFQAIPFKAEGDGTATQQNQRTRSYIFESACHQINFLIHVHFQGY